jgi:hypothetical protein
MGRRGWLKVTCYMLQVAGWLIGDRIPTPSRSIRSAVERAARTLRVRFDSDVGSIQTSYLSWGYLLLAQFTCSRKLSGRIRSCPFGIPNLRLKGN